MTEEANLEEMEVVLFENKELKFSYDNIEKILVQCEERFSYEI